MPILSPLPQSIPSLAVCFIFCSWIHPSQYWYLLVFGYDSWQPLILNMRQAAPTQVRETLKTLRAKWASRRQMRKLNLVGGFKTFCTGPKMPCAEPILFRLPMELFLDILSYLPLKDKVCLALSCKGIYSILSHELKADELSFPRMPIDKSAYDTLKDKCHLRIAFLSQLENDRWAACGRCQMLHPHHEFFEDRFKGLPPTERKCLLWAGIVDLCPCIALTFRHQAYIVEFLKGEKAACEERSLTLISKGLMQAVLNNNDGLYLIHRCTAYPSASVEIRLSLTKNGQLAASSRYQACRDTLSQILETTYSCCGNDMSRCLSSHICPWCRARVIDLSISKLRDMQVIRFLRGSLKSTTPLLSGPLAGQWFSQCRSLGNYIHPPP